MKPLVEELDKGDRVSMVFLGLESTPAFQEAYPDSTLEPKKPW
ncbi:MAG: hypothetical protein AAGD25_25415 [Cyanobacteria bacterium P01_F01_bin.150]